MFPLYAAWALLPLVISRARLLAEPMARHGCVLGIAALCAFQDDTINKDRATYGLLIQAAGDGDMLAMEPGFYLLIRALGLVFGGQTLETMFFFVVAALSISIKFELFRRYGGSLFGCLAAFFSYFFLLHEVTQVRIGLAIGLLYFSWFSYAQGQRAKFWRFGVLASLFHFSCLLFVVAPFLFARGRRLWRDVVLGACCALAATSVLAGSFMLQLWSTLASAAGIERVGIYFDLLQEGVLVNISPLRLLPHSLLLVIAAAYQQQWKNDRATAFLFRIYLYGALTFLIFWPIPALAYRISDLFLFAGVLLLGRMRRYLGANLYYPFVAAYTGVFLFYTLQYSGLFLEA